MLETKEDSRLKLHSLHIGLVHLDALDRHLCALLPLPLVDHAVAATANLGAEFQRAVRDRVWGGLPLDRAAWHTPLRRELRLRLL